MVDPISDQTNTEADTVSLQVVASGGDGSLSYASTGLPDGLSIDPVTGEISGVIDSSAADNSPYNVEVTVDDSDGDASDVVSTNFVWTVDSLIPPSAPIVVNPISDQTNTEADTVSLHVVASGGDGSLSYAATGLPDGLSIDPVTGEISGVIDSSAADNSPYNVEVTVDDSDGDASDVVSTNFVWTVDSLISPSVPIVLDPIADQTDTEGDAISLAVVASGGGRYLELFCYGSSRWLEHRSCNGFNQWRDRQFRLKCESLYGQCNSR